MASDNEGGFVLTTKAKGPDELQAEALKAIADIYRASQSRFWRCLAVWVVVFVTITGLGAVASAVFAGLTYLC